MKETIINLIILTLSLVMSFLLGILASSPKQITPTKTISIIAEKADCEKRGGQFYALFQPKIAWEGEKSSIGCDFPAPPSIDYLKDNK